MGGTGRFSVAVLIVALAATLVAPSASVSPAPGMDALDRAFLFASAIQTAPKDKGRAQHTVVLDYIEVGALDTAQRRIEAVEGWRRGVAYADLAAELARRGETKKARSMIEQAAAIGSDATGWYGPRISSRMARALALLGDVEHSAALGRELAAGDPRQYQGTTVADRAIALAATGRFEEGMKVLESLASATDLDLTWPRTDGYLELARMQSLDLAQRSRAAEAAQVSAAGVPGERQLHAWIQLAERYRDLGRAKEAGKALETAEELLAPAPDNMPAKSTLLAYVAAAWARQGNGQRARRVLEQATASAPAAGVTERPGVWGNIASVWRLVGDRTEADVALDRALEMAEGLANSRPRALAGVVICRFQGLAEGGFDDASATRVEALLEGLGDPW